MNVADFQKWLNERSAWVAEPIAVDGKGGPATRNRILSVFSNKNAPAVTADEIATFGARLGGTSRQVNKVGKVESSGSGFNDQGQPKALYERHYAWRRLRILIPFLSNPAPGGYTMDADNDGINDSWEKVADMAMRHPLVAFESASFGKFQVMGAWAEKLGYENAIEMVYSLTRSEAAHYELLCRYIERFGLKPAFRALSDRPDDCRAFARGYNGAGYERGGYHLKLARA